MTDRGGGIQMSTSKTIAAARISRGSVNTKSFLLTRVQPALSGLMDGSLSTLAPIFAVALAAFSEGLSDIGDLTGRGRPGLRGAITGGGTFAGGIFHTLPFLIPGYGAAISAAVAAEDSPGWHGL